MALLTGTYGSCKSGHTLGEPFAPADFRIKIRLDKVGAPRGHVLSCSASVPCLCHRVHIVRHSIVNSVFQLLLSSDMARV
jgi:hypothetical protein